MARPGRRRRLPVAQDEIGITGAAADSELDTLGTIGSFRSTSEWVGVIAPIAQASSTINFGVCAAPPYDLDVTATYSGYVEPVHALTYLHP